MNSRRWIALPLLQKTIGLQQYDYFEILTACCRLDGNQESGEWAHINGLTGSNAKISPATTSTGVVLLYLYDPVCVVKPANYEY